MTIKQMLYYSSICKTLNLTKSSQELFVSQPALSMAMKELENEVGMILFVKNGTKLGLTESGYALLQEVDGLLNQYNRLETNIRSGNLTSARIRFGFSSVVGTSQAAKLCGTFLSRHPEIKLQIMEDIGKQLLLRLEDNTLDVVLTGSKYNETGNWAHRFKTRSIDGDSIGFYVSKRNRLARKAMISFKEISEIPVILLDKNYPVFNSLEQLFIEKGYPLTVAFRTSNLYTAERFIMRDAVAGFLPYMHDTEYYDLVNIKCPELVNQKSSKLCLYWKKSSENNNVVKTFLLECPLLDI